jgi:hypothetical protein
MEIAMFSVLIIDSIYNVATGNASFFTSTNRAKHDFGIFGRAFIE